MTWIVDVVVDIFSESCFFSHCAVWSFCERTWTRCCVWGGSLITSGGCRYWPPNCESHHLQDSSMVMVHFKLKCQPSASEQDNNHNEEFVTTAVKRSSNDGLWRILRSAMGEGGCSPDKSRSCGLLLTSRPLDESHQRPYLMEITCCRSLRHVWVGSPRGRLSKSQESKSQSFPEIMKQDLREEHNRYLKNTQMRQNKIWTLWSQANYCTSFPPILTSIWQAPPRELVLKFSQIGFHLLCGLRATTPDYLPNQMSEWISETVVGCHTVWRTKTGSDVRMTAVKLQWSFVILLL